jgi:glycosyltransferase involved in cell wall biosynthesis
MNARFAGTETTDRGGLPPMRPDVCMEAAGPGVGGARSGPGPQARAIFPTATGGRRPRAYRAGVMRILFVNSVRGWGGGASSAHQLATGLAAAGHEVTVVCNPGSEIEARLARTGIPFAPVRSRADFDPFAAAALARTIRRLRPDVAIADRRKDVKQLVLARALGAAVPTVHRHGAPSTLRDSRVYRWVWSRVACIVVNSHAMRERLRNDAGWLRTRTIDVVHNGIDTTYFRPLPDLRHETRGALGIAAHAFVASFHGILQERKRVHLLIRAAMLLQPAVDVHLLIIGDGPNAAALRELAGELQVPATFTGLRGDIPELLAGADVSVHLSDSEGFSNSVLEALACGLPVVASDATSHPEQIEDGVTGILVAPGDPAAVADALRNIALDRARRDAMARAARTAA